MNQAGELVLSRNQLLRALDGHSRDIPGLAAILQNISQVTSELQEGIMQTRMQPIGTVFNRFPRIIRDMARQLGKQIEIEIKGAEVELDKSIVELLTDPLTHIIRNCADHAIEMPDERRRLKKNPTGQLLLHAYHQGGQVIIAITDDGRGIDPKKVLAKAVAKGHRQGGPGQGDDRARDRQPGVRARASPPPRPFPISPAGAWAWTWCAPTPRSWAATWNWRPRWGWAPPCCCGCR